MNISEEVKALHKESTVMDIHCHPSNKVMLFDYKIYEDKHYVLPDFPIPLDPVPTSPDDEIFQMQYDLSQMDKGGVNSIWSCIYVVEKGLADYSSLKYGVWASAFLGMGFEKVFERDTPSGAFVQATELMQKMEEQVKTAKDMGRKVRFAKNTDELRAGLTSGEKCFIHSLEGAHLLGRNYDNPQKYFDALEAYHNLGVCAMTLAHFFPNNLCFPVNGISPHTKESIGFTYDGYKSFENVGLTEVGRAIAEKMLDIGMIIDLTHLSPKGRKDVYEINNRRVSRGLKKRPLVFTHVGVREFCKAELQTPANEEILEIKNCGGTIGVIFMNYWLRGSEGEPDLGIKNIQSTIKWIAHICGNYEHISIGSDLDGLTQPVDDLYTSSQMMRLTQTLYDDPQIDGAENIKKILGSNSMRVLEEGWR